MRIFKTALTLCLLALSLTSLAQKPFDMNLWQGKPAEKSVDKTDTARVRVYLPNAKRATGRAVVICPGGGYTHLAMDHEGYQWGAFFNNMGIAAIVLKYRMPHGKPEVPVSDAEEAIRLVRRNAEKWHINPNDVGIMGFSAGGHLASTIATHSVKDAKPDFQILFYPVITMDPAFTHQGSHDNLLGKDAKKKTEDKYSSDMQVTRVTPRRGVLPPRRACLAACLSFRRPRLGHPRQLQIPYRNGAGTACLAAKLLEFLYWADIQNKFLFFLLIATDIRWVPGRRKPVNSSSSSPGISVNSSPT